MLITFCLYSEFARNSSFFDLKGVYSVNSPNWCSCSPQICHILSRLATVVCGKIIISMCFDILPCAMYKPVYRCFAFSSIFSLHNCIQICPSLKSVLKITIFCVFEKPLFLWVFVYPERFSIHFFHRNESMKVSCYSLYFSHKILIFLLFFYICRMHLTLTLGENGKRSVDWFVVDRIIWTFIIFLFFSVTLN
jgi:hypothetical protein